jgi:ATP-dependent DNA helicase RecQ
MKSIAFIDTEVDAGSRKVLDIGSVRGNGAQFHKASMPEFVSFLSGTQFI